MTREAFVKGLLLGLVPLVALGGCTKYPPVWEGKAGPPRVLVSFPPLFCFVKNVAGDHAGLISLCTTTGPHHTNYNAQELIYLRGADLFFANGLELDDKFTDKLYKTGGHSRMKYVKLGEILPDNLLIHNADGGKKHVHADGSFCEHGEHDPHVWLGIPQAIAMVESIRDELKQADPKHAGDYDANAKAYVEELRQLHADGKKLLAGKKDRQVITFHESLAYFASKDSFDLAVAGVIMEGPGSEPSSPRLAQLVKLVKDKKIQAIAVEPQYPKTTSAQVLVTELKRKGIENVALVEIDPLETATQEDLQDPTWYVRKMRENLDNLAKALP